MSEVEIMVKFECWMMQDLVSMGSYQSSKRDGEEDSRDVVELFYRTDRVFSWSRIGPRDNPVTSRVHVRIRRSAEGSRRVEMASEISSEYK